MIAATVFNNIVSTLKNSPDLDYIKNVYPGFRFDMNPESMPFIAVEPTHNSEIEQDMNQYKKIYLDLDVSAFSYCPSDSDKAIVGDALYKGILDIENDIRAVLQSSNTLGEDVIDIQFNQTIFDIENITVESLREKYSVRGLVIPIRILYQQKDSL